MSTVNRLRCLEKLGEGTYGVVYKAKELATGQIVAFKRMIVSSEDEGVPATAIREVCLLKELRHKNIVCFHDVLFEPPKMTLIFEYCECDLKKYMERNRGSVIREAPQILKQMLLGLRYMHRRSVVHRDLKPENVLININRVGRGANNGSTATVRGDGAPVAIPQGLSNGANPAHNAGSNRGASVDHNNKDNNNNDDGRKPADNASGDGSGNDGTQLVVKLGDYGLARVENIPVKKYSHDVVSLWYRSPDVIMGSALYGFAVDMWSIGCIFVEMFTGKPLLSGRTDVDQLVRIFHLLGTPTPETWPSMMSYPKVTQMIEAATEFVREQLRTTSAHQQQQDFVAARRPKNVQQEATRHSSNEPNAAGVSAHSSDGDTICNSTINQNNINNESMDPPRKEYNFRPELQFPPALGEYLEVSHFRERAGDDGVDLLRKLLQYEPSHRLTAHEALCHPFLKNVTAPVQRPIDAMQALLRQSLEEHGLLDMCDA
ncbi:putative protein kinase [Trypanosoma grayi]|uniref:putative protein kinase n=1 Tax=Trypanosoma grayi TaxID=71804 RepID=UPI0004F4341D|nr:putative protein kinase [Trypanosoma grayi]KEG10813.1 putative protein kinase [Trypanosoma grayi]